VRENRLRTLWQQNRYAINGWLAIGNSFSAEVMAHQGFDTLTIDLQHGLIDYTQMVPMLQAISTTPTVPIVRVPWLEPAAIMKCLDAGAYGIICPMVNTREDAQRLVSYAHYAPRGSRSFGPVRANLYGGSDYAAKADDTIVVFAMIETRQALDNLDSILSVEGLDAVYIGPSDLSISYGMGPGMDHQDEKRLDLVMKILKACKKHGVHAGIHTGSTAYAKRMREAGYQLTTLLNDSRIMAAAAKSMVDEMKGPAAAAPKAKAKGGSVY